MRSREASIADRRSGHTLIELMLVIVLFSFAAAAIYPLGKSFYDRYVFREVYTGLQSALETSALRARNGLHDQDHGVRIASDAYVLFEGSAYATRNSAYDNRVPLPSVVDITGPEEIVFAKGAGTASTTQTLQLRLGEWERRITVHPAGIIE